jgi:hypothetical protein
VKVLFDPGTPVPLRDHLQPHQVDTAHELAWSELMNGRLLDQAESSGYEAFISTDQNLKHQQNLSDRRIRVFVLTSTSWPKIRLRADEIRDRLESLEEGGCGEVDI